MAAQPSPPGKTMQTFVAFQKGNAAIEVEADTYGLDGEDWVFYQATEWTDPDRREIRRIRKGDVNGIVLTDWD